MNVKTIRHFWFALVSALALVLTIHAADIQFGWLASATVDPTISYNLYWSTNMTAPFVLYGNTTNLTITVTNLTPAVYRFYVTATNIWGESVPSNMVQTPPGRPSAVTITIKKAQQ